MIGCDSCFFGFVDGFFVFKSVVCLVDDWYKISCCYSFCCYMFCSGEFFFGNWINIFGCFFIIIIVSDFFSKVVNFILCFFVLWFICFFFSFFLKLFGFGLLGFCIDIGCFLFFYFNDVFVDFIVVEGFFVIIYRGCVFFVVGGLYENRIFGEYCVV